MQYTSSDMLFTEDDFDDASSLVDAVIDIIKNPSKEDETPLFYEEDFNNDDYTWCAIDNDYTSSDTIKIIDASSSILNIQFTKTKSGNFSIHGADNLFHERYYFEPSMMYDSNVYDDFLTACERTIRKSMIYEAYIAYLKKELGFIRDAFNCNITDEMACLEMHHGPIFNLRSYVRILIDYAFDAAIPVSTFKIAELVMEEHTKNRVQIAMVTKNNHALLHAGKLHLNFNQCHGNIAEFIRIYKKFIDKSPVLCKRIYDYQKQIKEGKYMDTSFISPNAYIKWSGDIE